MKEYVIDLYFDKKKYLWIATIKHVKGLVFKSKSFYSLIKKIKIALPVIIGQSDFYNYNDIIMYMCFSSDKSFKIIVQ